MSPGISMPWACSPSSRPGTLPAPLTGGASTIFTTRIFLYLAGFSLTLLRRSSSPTFPPGTGLCEFNGEVIVPIRIGLPGIEAMGNHMLP